MSVTVAIQGDQASFHDIAASQFFDAASQRMYCETFGATFAALQSGEVDYALCAIENSLYGSINEVYDLVLKHNFFIFGEIYLRIEQCLIGLPGTELAAMRQVHSHPVAIAQCEQYLDEQLPQAERSEYHDTAASVALVRDLNDPTVAAIASRQAAELYGLEILAESIETNKANYTRFIALASNNSLMVKQPTKTSLVITTDHMPGSLNKALTSFASRDINLSKLQSRPIVGQAWHYMFYIDIDAGVSDTQCQLALAELRDQGCTVSVLGSYIGTLH